MIELVKLNSAGKKQTKNKKQKKTKQTQAGLECPVFLRITSVFDLPFNVHLGIIARNSNNSIALCDNN